MSCDRMSEPTLGSTPQLNSRWAARYASVLADDPGSAVMTLTSYGMVQRSRPRGREASPVIALWKDASRGVREIPLEAGAHGVLLTFAQDPPDDAPRGDGPLDGSGRRMVLAMLEERPSGNPAARRESASFVTKRERQRLGPACAVLVESGITSPVSS